MTPNHSDLWQHHVTQARAGLCTRRTPQGIRALARFYVVVFIPLFFGPYYADVRVGAHSFAFALFLAILVHSPCVATSLQLFLVLLDSPFVL
jgi:hypothetical protein